MKYSKKEIEKLKKVAIKLDNRLIGKVPNIVSVCIKNEKFNCNKMGLWVYIDNMNVKNKIPKKIGNYTINVEVIDTPQFANSIE